VTLFDLEPLALRHVHECVLSRVPSVTALEQGFPAATLSRIGEHESWRKEVHRPATSTHKWWAKRLGSIFRGILTAAVTENHTAALNAYNTATRLGGLTVFDPFAGSGTTVVEAAKLDANVIGWDINPVATLVQRQAVQEWDISELERAYKLVEEGSRAESTACTVPNSVSRFCTTSGWRSRCAQPAVCTLDSSRPMCSRRTLIRSVFRQRK
jgi:hypothetical protein